MEEAVVLTPDPSRTSGLQVTFARQADRYVHVVDWLRDGQSPVRLARSIEGDDVQPWPPSPPLQQLAAHAPPNRQQATLLLGMAGRSHWSMSVETQAGAIVFDVACRLADAPTVLGCTYHLANSSLECELGDRDASLRGAWGEVRLELLAIDGQPPCTLRLDRGNLRLDVPWTAGALPATVRWKYRFVVGG